MKKTMESSSPEPLVMNLSDSSKGSNKIGSLVTCGLLLFFLGFIVLSYQLGIGTLTRPGPGLWPFFVSISGAGAFRRLINITLPLMVPSFVVTIFLSLKNAFMVYDLNFSLTKGGPFNSTLMVSMHVVNKAFVEANYGTGQAEAIILFLIVAIVTGIQVYSSKKMEVEA